jgi:hypothetical protein
MSALDKEYKYYQANQKEFLRKYRNRVVVIKDEQVTGVYNDEESAYKEAISKYKLGSFLIQKCVPEEETIQSFYSNVIFS